MARWYLVRHGETDWNAQERVQGHTDIPINQTGRNAAELTGARLAQIPFAAAYTSDLVRTQETAQIILGQQRGDPPKISVRPALRELAYGIFEGKTWSEIRQLEPSLRGRPRDRYLDWAPEGGETFRALIDRLSEFATELRENHRDDDVLIASHGGSLRALVIAILDLPYEAYPRIRGLAPASISIITCEHHNIALTAWNDIGHLLSTDAL